MCGLDQCDSEQGLVDGCFEGGNEPSGPVKGARTVSEI